MWCWLVFVLIGVEITDWFRKLAAAGVYGSGGPGLEFAKFLWMAMAWAVYSATLVWYGLVKRTLPILGSGLLMMLPVVWLVVVESAALAPARGYVPVLNLRAAAFALVIAVVVIQRWLLDRRRGEYSWASSVIGFSRFVEVALGFELITIEWLGLVSRVNPGDAGLLMGASVGLVRLLGLGTLWAMFSAFLSWRGFVGKSTTFIACGLVTLTLSAATVAIAGSTFVPASGFVLLFNVRAAAFAAVFAAILFHHIMLSRNKDEYAWAGGGMVVMQVAASLLAFELVSAGTWSAMGVGPQMAQARQMALSVAWVVYSVLLMSLGIWRRVRAVRYVAIAFFEISILKVFLYDLASLDTVYRIFSFIGLGLFLLATSYLYQRFKGFIDEVDEPEAATRS